MFIDLTSGNSTLQIDNLEETINPTLNDFMIINQNGTIFKVKVETLSALFGGYIPSIDGVILTENSDYIINEDGTYLAY